MFAILPRMPAEAVGRCNQLCGGREIAGLKRFPLQFQRSPSRTERICGPLRTPPPRQAVGGHGSHRRGQADHKV